MMQSTQPANPAPEINLLGQQMKRAAPPQASQTAAELPLLSYVRSYGIEPLSLSMEAIDFFIAARALEPIVREINLPIANEIRRDNQKVRVEREVERFVEKTRYQEGERAASLPADSLNLSQLSVPEELRNLVPSQWLLQEVAPDEFDRLLISGQLLKREWREPTQTPFPSYESVKVKELVEEPAPPLVKRPHAYVLLDESGSMTEGDRRDITARGLALAFLHYAQEQRAQMYERRFGGTTGALDHGAEATDLARIARKIVDGIDAPHDGTDIHGALQTAVTDIRASGSKTPADILLITDGYSKLGHNPLGGVKLHTLEVGPANEFEADSEEAEQRAKLKSWSTTHRHVDNPLRNPRARKLDEQEMIAHANSLAGGMRAAKDEQALAKSWRELRKLSVFAEKMGFQKLAEQIRVELRRYEIPAVLEADQQPAVEESDFDFEQALKEEQQERAQAAANRPTQPKSTPAPSGGLLDDLDNRPMGFWQWLKQTVRGWFQ